MSNERRPELGLFLSILETLERIDAPYMVIGAFAAAIYGITRVTFDIDIVVDLSQTHIDALVQAYPLPRYYADPVQMRDAIRMGRMFNIIDTERGEKADLIPLTMVLLYRQAFKRRVRQAIDIPGVSGFTIWCARPEDVIVGKLMAWTEGRSRKHETDIYEMLVAQYLNADQIQGEPFDEALVDAQVCAMGDEVVAFWETLRAAAHREVGRNDRPTTET